MRSVPSDIVNKLMLKMQTKANSADPSASIWIGRPTTALTQEVFLERQNVLTAAVGDVSIAVCHPHMGFQNTQIYVAYLSNGEIRIITSPIETKMENHKWTDIGFSEQASAISMAFDGTMPHNAYGVTEFITEMTPWIFWVDAGVLYGEKLGTNETTTLAVSNCTDVSAVRAMWSDVGQFDFGLIVFFILSGTIYYRQYIKGAWTDAEVVSFGPAGVTWTEIVAFRTWDYRVGLQAKTSDGSIFELFTQFMGVGKQNTEHIEMSSLDVVGDITKIVYHNYKEEEHVEVNSIVASPLLQWGLPVFGMSANNVPDVDDDWGKRISIVLDHPCNAQSIFGSEGAFSLVDENNSLFVSSGLTASTDGSTIIVEFVDFNSAYGVCQLTYTPGTINSPPIGPEVSMQTWTVSFTPTNLVAPGLPVPEVEAIWNE